MVAVQQLKEEVYSVAQRKLVLEEELKTINFFITILKKELEHRYPLTPKQY